MTNRIDGFSEESRHHIDELNEQAWAMRHSDPARAVECAERAGRLSTEGGIYERGLAWSLLTRGSAAVLNAESVVAARDLHAALEHFQRSADRDGEAVAHGAIGNMYILAGEFQRALEHFQASLEICTETGDLAGLANTLGSISSVNSSVGEYSLALQNNEASIAIFRQIGNRHGEALRLNTRGIIFKSLGDYAGALDLFRASLQIFREISDRYGEASVLGNFGNIYGRMGEYPRALEHYQACLEIAREIGDRRAEARALVNVGGVYASFGEHEQASLQYDAALLLFREIGDRRGESTAHGNLGNTCSLLKDFPRALEHFDASLRISRDIGHRRSEAESLVGSGLAHLELGDVDAALAGLAGAVAITREIGARSTLGLALVGLGRTHAATGKPREALEALGEGLALAVELGERNLELDAHAAISRQQELLGDTATALAHLRRHTELKEEVFGEETRRTIHTLKTQSQIDIVRKEAEIERLRNVELKQALDDLKSAQSSLVQAEKMASLGQLTAGIAHEINNPINFVSSSLRPLRRNHLDLCRMLHDALDRLTADERSEVTGEEEIGEIVGEQEQLIAGIEDGARRTAEIVSGLRSFSRLDEGGLKRVDLHEGLDAALVILSGSMSTGIELVRAYGDLPDVECYPGEINQAFMNILANAVKAITGKGRITIETEEIDAMVRISIADTGVGMTPEVQSKIFEPFFTTRDVGEGRGLGLSIAWGIVRKHGGTIEVGSVPTVGSTFVITLPVAAVE